MIKIYTIKWAFKNLKLIVIALEEDIDLLQQKFMVISPLKVVKFQLAIVQLVIEKKSRTVSDTTILAEGWGDFFKNLGKKGLSVSKKMAKNIL